MNARFYVPAVGRFVSADTLVPDPVNPQSYNRYSYVRNSPLNFTDPTGHRECGAFDGELCGLVSVSIPKSPPPQPLRDPIEGFYLSGFDYNPGPRGEPGIHNGIDLVSDISTDVSALTEGRVRISDACTNDPCTNDTSGAANYGTGSVVIVEYVYDVIPENIRQALGLAKEESVYVQYQHLVAIKEGVSAGKTVLAGDIVGQYGNTGRSSGDHLHLEIHVGTSGALGWGRTDGTYDTYLRDWHDLNVVDPNLFWDIPTQ